MFRLARICVESFVEDFDCIWVRLLGFNLLSLSMKCDSALATNGDAVVHVVREPSHSGATRILKEETRHVHM
jgi:hypothetical protein